MSGAASLLPDHALGRLRCPADREPLSVDGDELVCSAGGHRFGVDRDTGIPRFAEQFCSPEARAQQAHYEKYAAQYVANLSYPHTDEYMKYLDGVFLEVLGDEPLGAVAEVCCGNGEAKRLLGKRFEHGYGLDVSISMLAAARARTPSEAGIAFIQGDATMLPFDAGSLDTVLMLGGIHHVPDRQRLFEEIARVLRPGGRLVFREPVSDFFLWRWIRAVVYRVAPALDHQTERPLLWSETVPVLRRCGFDVEKWRTCGFLGFCLLMNSDVLVFNRLFRFIPGIRALTRWTARLDELTVRLPGMSRAGLQVVGSARRLPSA